MLTLTIKKSESAISLPLENFDSILPDFKLWFSNDYYSPSTNGAFVSRPEPRGKRH